MAKTNNFIELNGKRYDAVTGAFLGPGPAATTATPLTTALKTPSRGAVIDGVLPKTKAVSGIATPKKPAPVHHSKPLAAHKPEHTKTLRRDIVKPPVITAKKAIKPQAPTDLVQHKPGVLTVAPKLSSDIIDPARASRASQVARSPRVERFRRTQAVRHATMAAPAARPIQQHAATSSLTRTPVSIPARHAVTARPPADTDIFEQAIAYARSHEQPVPRELGRQKTKRSKKYRRVTGIFASVLMVAALGGFIFWQNRADIELQLASARSGVPASMPAYKPTGFAVKGLTYSPGSVTIGFHSTNGNFNVTQKTSNWDSETLLQNYVATSGQAYNAYQAAGRTVYIYGNDNATWVNGGVWYQVNDNGLLNKDQIINLATSM